MEKAKFKVGSFVRHRNGGVYFITRNPDDGYVMEETLEPRYEYAPVIPHGTIKGFSRSQSKMEDGRFELIPNPTMEMKSAKLRATFRSELRDECGPVFEGASNPTPGFIEEQPPEGTNFCDPEVAKAAFRAAFRDHPEWFDEEGNIKGARSRTDPKLLNGTDDEGNE